MLSGLCQLKIIQRIEEMKNNTKKWALGGILLASTSYLAGVLTAPKSGKSTRSIIKIKTYNTKMTTEKQLKIYYSQLNELIESGAAQINTIKLASDKDLNDLLSKAVVTKNLVRKVLNDIHDRGADNENLQNAGAEAKKSIQYLKKYISSK